MIGALKLTLLIEFLKVDPGLVLGGVNTTSLAFWKDSYYLGGEIESNDLIQDYYYSL